MTTHAYTHVQTHTHTFARALSLTHTHAHCIIRELKEKLVWRLDYGAHSHLSFTFSIVISFRSSVSLAGRTLMLCPDPLRRLHGPRAKVWLEVAAEAVGCSNHTIRLHRSQVTCPSQNTSCDQFSSHRVVLACWSINVFFSIMPFLQRNIYS